MSKVIVIVSLIILVALGCLVAINVTKNNNGIVILDGFQHGVALCEENFSTVVRTDEASFWNDGKATFVINRGHESDPEVQELVQLAQIKCSQL